ncbi:MAG: hypothetical protein ACRC67_35445 [Inquilinus sp.]|uniref:hypothetical protein n=1 Tax=Inquilinus sp. TaxID=1932117 RepID=UPI003F35D9E5
MSFRLCAIAAALTATLAMPAQAQLLFMITRSGAKLTAEDMATVRTSVGRLLAQQKVGTADGWTASNGVTGETTLARLFESDGYPCAEIKLLVSRAGRQTPYTFNVCKNTDGQWLIAP